MTALLLKVLHISPSLGLGGTEKAMQLMVSNLDRERFQPCVFAYAGGPRKAQLKAAGVPTVVGRDPYPLLLKFNPDIVHLHRAGWPEPARMRPLALIKGNKARPAVVETNVFGRFDPSPSGEIIDTHIFISRFCAERYAREHGGEPTGPGRCVIHYPVDTDFFVRHTGPRDFSKPTIGRLTRADPGKWSPLALDILPFLAERIPGFTCRIIGGVPEAEAFVAARNLQDSVVFLKPATTDAELAEFFSGISLLAHANDTGETFGLAIAEAMAAGLPVVTHPSPYPKDNAQVELVEDGVTGFVADNARDYAAAVIRLLSDPGLAQAMGEAGRRKAQREFRAQHIAEQLAALYLESAAGFAPELFSASLCD